MSFTPRAMLSRSPLARVRILFSSRTEFRFSIQLGSTGPSTTKNRDWTDGCTSRCQSHIQANYQKNLISEYQKILYKLPFNSFNFAKKKYRNDLNCQEKIFTKTIVVIVIVVWSSQCLPSVSDTDRPAPAKVRPTSCSSFPSATARRRSRPSSRWWRGPSCRTSGSP